MGVAAHETAYVGDFFHIDVTGARSAGLHAVLIDPQGLHADRDCARVAELAELLELLA
jgi:FMN phosphatase YigB (HAD superfamily)